MWLRAGSPVLGGDCVHMWGGSGDTCRVGGGRQWVGWLVALLQRRLERGKGRGRKRGRGRGGKRNMGSMRGIKLPLTAVAETDESHDPSEAAVPATGMQH